MLLSNVMLVPGMNTFIEPKHTLQVATPTPMLLEQREYGHCSELAQFIKG